MSLYRQNSNKPFIFIVLLLFFVVLLMIPLRPSVWDRADALSERSDTTQLVGADSLLSRDSLVLTTVSIQDTQLSFLPKIDDPTLIDTIVVIQTLEATDTTIITLSVPPPAPQTIEKAETTGPGLLSLLWWLLLFTALAWGIYKWLTTRWQKQYWLEYNAELQPLATLSNSNSNIDFDFSELSVEAATIEKPAPLPLKEIVPEIIEESVSIEPELPEEEEEEEEEPDLIEVEPEPISDKETKETEETVNPPEPEIIQTELTSSTATIASETPFSERWYVLFFIEFFGRLPRILFEMGRGMGSIFSFFSTGNQNRKSLDLKWQDGVSVVLILFFILCKTILFPYAPASLVGTIFLGLLVWGIPALLRQHWGLGAVGIVLILGEFVSLIIYIALQALENVEPGDGDYTNELIGLAIVVGLVVLYWASKKGLLPSFGKLVSFVLIAIGSYFIFLPYVEDLSYGYLFFYGWGDIVIRCIAFYILYLVLTEVISAVFIKKEAPNPTLKTEKAALKIAKDSNLDTTETSKSEEASKPLSTQELEELFRTKNWYKKADLDQLELVSMSSSSLDEQSEFVVLYLPDCINLYQLYLSNNNFQEIPYEISALEQLEILDLSYNKINTIISEIEYLKNLKVLFLTNNNISDIPTELANLTQLTQIDLTGNPLTKAAVHQLKTYFPNAILKFDPPKEKEEETEVIVEDIVEEAQNTTLIEDEALVKKVRKSLHKELKNPEQTYGLSSLMNQELPDLPLSVLQEFPNLKSLFLNGNLFTEIPEAIYHLPNLTALGFSYNKITSLPDRISSLQNLKELYLSGNPIHSISPAIIQLHNLEKIDLGNLGLTVFPAFLLKMQQLESINLTGNHILRIPKDIQELSNLKELNLSFSGLNTIPDEIFALKNLRALEWTGNKLENIPSRIVELEHLEKLAIGFNEGLESSTNVLKGLPNLKYLYISGLKGGMKQPMILNVGLLKPLETLWLSYNELKDLPISLFDLKNIRRLSLANNKLETLSERLGEFSNLEYLYLEKNQLTRLPKSIKKLEKLRHLNLANNPIDIKEKRALQRVLPRVKIQF